MNSSIVFFSEIIIVSILLLVLDGRFFNNTSTKELSLQQDRYNSYYAFDTEKRNVLILSETPCNKKLLIWKNSFLKEEMLTRFPDMYAMTTFIEGHVEDSGLFKSKLIDYMEYIHGEYVSGNLSEGGYKNAVANPDPSLPAY